MRSMGAAEVFATAWFANRGKRQAQWRNIMIRTAETPPIMKSTEEKSKVSFVRWQENRYTGKTEERERTHELLGRLALLGLGHF